MDPAKILYKPPLWSFYEAIYQLIFIVIRHVVLEKQLYTNLFYGSGLRPRLNTFLSERLEFKRKLCICNSC